jgi:hypothetical protein
MNFIPRPATLRADNRAAMHAVARERSMPARGHCPERRQIPWSCASRSWLGSERKVHRASHVLNPTTHGAVVRNAYASTPVSVVGSVADIDGAGATRSLVAGTSERPAWIPFWRLTSLASVASSIVPSTCARVPRKTSCARPRTEVSCRLGPDVKARNAGKLTLRHRLLTADSTYDHLGKGTGCAYACRGADSVVQERTALLLDA